MVIIFVVLVLLHVTMEHVSGCDVEEDDGGTCVGTGTGPGAVYDDAVWCWRPLWR